ncbi:MAG: TIR domain-containing protein [Geobacteraceae bacterium]|nr:TIR domain-containing protein [Geobacteraceae bacterium]NTW78719.1 TIR domain-containing protein [Geobacteraceae bacterium]
MSPQYKPPIAVHFIWHPLDSDTVDPILEAITRSFSRDINRPFSRNLNIPIFFYSSCSPTDVPNDLPSELALRNVLFVFTSVNTRGYTLWDNYINNLKLTRTMRAVPVALSHEGLGHGGGGSLKNINFIRVYEWQKEYMVQNTVLAMAHELYRHGFIEIEEQDQGKSSSIKLFLSHAKSGDTGRLHAESIKRFIDTTNMSHFFDATTISPGFKFDEEIIKSIKESTMLAICSDDYSSRYWCQREILSAKEHHRPMIAINCLEDFEDRIFPAGSNIPCVHISPESPLKESDVLKILTAAILETIRHCHALSSLEHYQARGWIDSRCALFSRPPEIRQLLTLKSDGQKNKLCYPEPPIYSEEGDWHSHLSIETFTPLWSSSDNNSLKGLRVGISVSDVASACFKEHHLPTSQSVRLAQDLARHLLARSATLIYGGDLRKDGFTEFILNEAVALKSRLNTHDIHVENHLAWPIHKADKEMTSWRANYRAVMNTVEHDIPADIANDVDTDQYLPPTSPQNKYIWSRCLTEMRQQSIDSSHARVCAGGKISGYNGKMPGVLEEILIAIDKNKPIYLLGAFGGIVGEVCKILRQEPYPDSLTETWQVTYNAEYVDLQTLASKSGNNANYGQVKTILEGIDVSTISKNAGLDEATYLRLMATPFVDECIYLIIQGLKNLST